MPTDLENAIDFQHGMKGIQLEMLQDFTEKDKIKMGLRERQLFSLHIHVTEF
jgi:hypothetical protein